ncbi:MAG: hypothetical protein M1832_004384 [Thelocarpon impressellum]|nr:MAG: hypothetical protein M1832_004384 [Thelocarpon impressellum]
MSNLTAAAADLPPLPSYTLSPLPPLVAPIPDKLLILLLPIAAYWIVSLFFHFIDARDYLPQYRLHTPVEVLKRNRVSRADVVRDVVLQQLIQTVIGALLGFSEPEDLVGKEGYDVAGWAQRIRLAQRALPPLLATLGLDAVRLAENMAGSYPALSAAIAGGSHPLSLQSVSTGPDAIPAFAGWEIALAKANYWFFVPALQFAVAIFIVDTWQYFLHRAMHMNQWLYRTFHSRHHRLYVPYAFGALYNHPFEGFLLDTLGAAVAFKLAGFTTRQGMWFFTCSTIKTVDDHCGYALPWDPLQLLTSNNAGYHDVHHQSWGIKSNFSQPFFTFWDRAMGTIWTGGDVSARYERSRLAVERKLDLDAARPITGSVPEDSLQPSDAPYENALAEARILLSEDQDAARPAVPAGKATQQAAASRDQVLQDSAAGDRSVLADEADEEEQAALSLRRSPRKKSASSTQQVGSLKNLSERVSGSLQGRSGGVLGMESSR